jgi:hypothetical protein
MTQEQRAALREAASKATPGPWRHFSFLSGTEFVQFEEAEGCNQYGGGSKGAHITYRNVALFGMDEDQCDAAKMADARYIALAHPAAVLALLAENERMREALEEIERSHIPSVPIAVAPMDDLVWAQQHVGTLRRIARAALDAAERTKVDITL